MIVARMKACFLRRRNRMEKDEVRKLLYDRYVLTSIRPLVPVNLEGLDSRKYYFDRIIKEHFPPNKNISILEIGCGHGAFIHFIKKAGYANVIGFDNSPDQVSESKRLGITGVFQRDAIEGLRCINTESIDLVVAIDVLEHLRKDELFLLANEACRVLRRGGKWIIHTPNGESPFFGRVLYGDLTHETAFTRNSITQLLKSSGFNTVSVYEDSPVIHGLKSAIRFLLWKISRTFLRIYIDVESGESDLCLFSQNIFSVAKK